jgi:curli biogenesis system outer membrane secretion channel CsgG
MRKPAVTRTLLLQGVAALALGACVATSNPAPMVKGPPVFGSDTPYSPALACLGREVTGQPKYAVGVGNVTDRSGKFSLDGVGYHVSQGPDLMVITALARSDAVVPVERLDTRPLEWELNLENQKVVGKTERDDDQNNGDRWRHIHAGVLHGSDFYIVGAITGIDYNTFSGGAEASINGYGAGARQWREMVYADLRMVNTKTGEIVAVGSPYKEMVGTEVEAGIFRFFGSTLVNFDAGGKASEPVQLGVRAMMERAVFDMLHKVYRLPSGDECERIADAIDRVAVGGAPTITADTAPPPLLTSTAVGPNGASAVHSAETSPVKPRAAAPADVPAAKAQ